MEKGDQITFSRRYAINNVETFTKSKEFNSYLFQSIVTFVQPFIFLNEVKFKYYYNDVNYTNAKLNYIFLTIYLPTRYWNMIKYLIVSSYFYSNRAQRFANMYQTEVTISFALKCILKAKPISCILVLFFSNIFLGGYLIRIWERFQEPTLGENFDNYENCIWYAFITMCTVGYGDMSAKSIIGRFLVTCVAIIGVFINSTLTVVMTENFTFKGGELKAYNMLNQIEMRERLDLITRKLILRCFKLYKLRKQRARNMDPRKVRFFDRFDSSLVKQRDLLLKHIKDVREKVRTCFKSEPIEMVIDKLVDVRKSVRNIKESIDKFEDVMHMSKENLRNLEIMDSTIQLSENKI